jgi:hypothetical protein
VGIDGLLRPINFFHGAFEGAPVHAFWLFNVVADSSLAPNFPAKGEGSRQRAITCRFTLRSIAKPIGFPRREGVRSRGQIQLRGALARARADEKPASAAERLRPGRQRDAVFAMARFAGPLVRGSAGQPALDQALTLG